VTITNTGAEPIDLEGFELRDESSVNRFEFPVVILAPANQIRITSGCGTQDEATIAWCSAQPVWNNEGDTALLADPAGRIVAFFRY
jgi:competence protein ComEC